MQRATALQRSKSRPTSRASRSASEPAPTVSKAAASSSSRTRAWGHGAPTLLLLDLPADPPAGLPYDLRPSAAPRPLVIGGAVQGSYRLVGILMNAKGDRFFADVIDPRERRWLRYDDMEAEASDSPSCQRVVRHARRPPLLPDGAGGEREGGIVIRMLPPWYGMARSGLVTSLATFCVYALFIFLNTFLSTQNRRDSPTKSVRTHFSELTALGAGTAATGCRSCVLFVANTRRFEAGRGGHVNTLNTSRPIDAALASLGGCASWFRCICT